MHEITTGAMASSPQLNQHRTLVPQNSVHAEFHEFENTRDWIHNNLATTRSLQELRMHETTTGRGNCNSLGFCSELREPLRIYDSTDM
jgi:hypothetical protein